jgi:hypothetical protein
MSELIYTFIIIVLLTVLIFLLYNFFQKTDSKQTEETMYIPGVYTSEISLNNANFEIKMTFDDNHINDISIQNVSDSVSAMYPLIMPTFETITSQIITNGSTENINCPDSSKYTGQLLLNNIIALEDQAKR